MPKLSCLLVVAFLAACGMKGGLYETPTPPASAAEPADEDQGGRKTTPPAPDPALAR